MKVLWVYLEMYVHVDNTSFKPHSLKNKLNLTNAYITTSLWEFYLFSINLPLLQGQTTLQASYVNNREIQFKPIVRELFSVKGHFKNIFAFMGHLTLWHNS